MIGIDPNNNKYDWMTIEAKNPAKPCPMRSLPKDVIMIIFSYVKPDFPALALVNRRFRNIVDDKQLCTPSSACDKKEWEDHIGAPVEAPPLPRLPRRIHKDLKDGRCLLTLIPHTIKIITNEDKTPKEVLLTAKAMGELAKTPKKGHATCYDRNSWSAAINEKRVVEKSHWFVLDTEVDSSKQEDLAKAKKTAAGWKKVSDFRDTIISWFVLDTEAIGKRLHYSKKKDLAEAKKTAAEWKKVSDFRDTIISLFMEKIRTGKSYFVWSDYHESTWIRVDTMTNGMRIVASFGSSGLHIGDGSLTTLYEYVVVAVARKSIGI